jgi:hypothetical protein
MAKVFERILVGLVNVSGGAVGRLINLPTGGIRIEIWVKGAGWTKAPEGSLILADFMPGATKPVSPEIAAREGIPAAELDDVTDFEIELEKHDMKQPRKIYGLLWGRELPTHKA